jgi:ABC-type thiamine transport system substrate-binding protein
MFMEEYLLMRFKKEKSMSIFRTGLSLVFVLIMTNQSLSQAISQDYQKMCAREQVAEHRGIKGKALTEEDFSAYCGCQAEFITKNATNRQVNELVMNPKARPEWLKVIELKAMRACIADPKMST